METIKNASRRLENAEKNILTGLILLMAVLSFVQVVLRGLFSSGLLWADTFNRYLVLWVGFLGAGLAAAQDKQFAFDAAARFFSAPARRLVSIAVHFFTAAVCVLLTSASSRLLAEEYRSGRALFSLGTIALPAWILEIIIPLGFALLFVHYVLKLLAEALEPRA